MRYLIAGAIGATVYMIAVYATSATSDRAQIQGPVDPSAGQIKGWRACIDDGEKFATQCAPGVFLTLAACQAFNAYSEYGDEASCFDAIDEVKEEKAK